MKLNPALRFILFTAALCGGGLFNVAQAAPQYSVNTPNDVRPGVNPAHDARQYGMKGDYRALTGLSLGTPPNSNLMAATSQFTLSDVGKAIVIAGAGAAGADLVTTITAYVSATNVTLAAPNGTSVSGVAGHVGTDNRAAFNTLVNTTLSANGGTVVVSRGTFYVGSDLTIPANVKLRAEGDGRITVAGGATLTLQGPVEFGSQAVFDLSAGGSVSFSGNATLQEINVKWFGATGDGATDDDGAIQAAIDAVPFGSATKGATRILLPTPSVTYRLSQTITIAGRFNVTLAGPSRKFYHQTAATVTDDTAPALLTWAGAAGGDMILGDDTYGLTLENITLDGRGTAGVGLALGADGAAVSNNKYASVRNFGAKNCNVGIRVGDFTANGPDTAFISFENTTLFDCKNQGVKVNSGNAQVSFNHVWLSANGETPDAGEKGADFYLLAGELTIADLTGAGQPADASIYQTSGGVRVFGAWSDMTQGQFLYSTGATSASVLSGVRHYAGTMTRAGTPVSVRWQGPQPLTLSGCYLYGDVQAVSGNNAHIVDLGTQFVAQTAVTTGTLSVVNGSTAVVGTGTSFTANDVDKLITVGGVVYQVATFTDTTHITLNTAYLGSTDGMATYSLDRTGGFTGDSVDTFNGLASMGAQGSGGVQTQDARLSLGQAGRNDLGNRVPLQLHGGNLRTSLALSTGGPGTFAATVAVGGTGNLHVMGNQYLDGTNFKSIVPGSTFNFKWTPSGLTGYASGTATASGQTMTPVELFNIGYVGGNVLNNLMFRGDNARRWYVDRHPTADTGGNPLTIDAGGAATGATNKAGGDLKLDAGIGTGSATGASIRLRTPTATGSGTTDQALADRLVISAAGADFQGLTGTFGQIINSGVTANTLLYANGSKQVSSVTIGSGLSLSGGTLSNTGVLSESDTLSSVTGRGNTTTTGIQAASFTVGSSGPTITTGVGAPASTNPTGSLYLNSTGLAGFNLYIRDGGSVWRRALVGYTDYNVNWDSASIPANSTAETTVTATGAVTTDQVVVSSNDGYESGLMAMAWVSAADTITVRLANVTTGAIDPAAHIFSLTVIRH